MSATVAPVPSNTLALTWPALAFIRQAQSELNGIGADEIDMDPVFPFESADDRPDDLVSDLHRIPGDTAFLFRGFDQGGIGGEGRAGRCKKA